ncbi:hypothetical protein PQX77_007956, partial [Marasmius sp. AFHP31]
AKHLLVLTISSEFSTIGIVELELGSASGLVLLLFVIPLAFTLNATRTELRVRKQRNKSSMLEKLNYVLVFSVVVTLIFVVLSFSSSGRLAGDEADAEDHDLESMADHAGSRSRDDDQVALAGEQRGPSTNDRLEMTTTIALLAVAIAVWAGRLVQIDPVGKMNATGPSMTEIDLKTASGMTRRNGASLLEKRIADLVATSPPGRLHHARSFV